MMDDYSFRFSKSSKYLNSVLLIIPMVLLFIGIYGGLMQTFSGPELFRVIRLWAAIITRG